MRLQGKGAAQQLLVIGTYADGLERDLTESSRFSIADPALAEIDDQGRVWARSDGRTLLTIQSPGQFLQAAVQVRDSALIPRLRFDRDIARILTKRGCNSTECHGRVTGEGGFKLSKNATAPREDYRWIVEGGTFHVLTAETGKKAPRIRLEDPAQSLLLLKASLAVPHGGGKRLEEDSPDYRRILDWIGEGALYGVEDGARSVPLERVAVAPGQVVLQKGGGRQLLVTAHWADGAREDITRAGSVPVQQPGSGFGGIRWPAQGTAGGRDRHPGAGGRAERQRHHRRDRGTGGGLSRGPPPQFR